MYVTLTSTLPELIIFLRCHRDLCDNCLQKSNVNHLLLAKFPTTVPKHPISPSSDVEDSPRQEPDEQGKWQMAESAKVANHHDNHLKGA
jgi:hypothetical protein